MSIWNIRKIVFASVSGWPLNEVFCMALLVLMRWLSEFIEHSPHIKVEVITAKQFLRLARGKWTLCRLPDLTPHGRHTVA
jgi:hypothetical protein